MILYHCSVFCTTVPFFFHKKQQHKNGTVCFYTTVPFFHKGQRNKTEQCVSKNRTVCFVPLFRFCTTVPFLYHCSVYSIRDNDVLVWSKTEQCVFVPLFRFFTTVPFLYHCSVFALLFRFFHDGTKTEQCVLYHCSVFSYH